MSYGSRTVLPFRGVLRRAQEHAIPAPAETIRRILAPAGRSIRNLSLPWKLALPPLAMVLVFAPPAFAIVRDLTNRAETDLQQELARRVEQARSAFVEGEFYLLEAVRFAANVEGLPAAVGRSDVVAVRDALGSVAALKDRVDLLAVTDAAGVGLVEISRTNGKRTVSMDTDWTGDELVVAVLRDVAPEDKRPGLVRFGDTDVVAVAGPVRVGDRTVGAVLAGLSARGIVDEARKRAGASLAFFGPDGELLAGKGSLRAPAPRREVPSAGSLGRYEASGKGVSVLYVPVEMGGVPLGTLAVALPRAPAFAEADRVTKRLQYLLAAAIAAGLVLLVLLTRLLLAQIAHLVRTNEALGRGELSSRAAVLGSDELGQVAGGLNAMAAKLEASYAELEERVEERTRELRMARDAAEEATKVKAAFLANMSHEIRTPMNAVVGMTSLLLDMPLGTVERDYVETVRSSGDHLLTIINDILDFSKIEAGHVELELQPFVVRSCVEEALDLVAFRASQQRTELVCMIQDDVPGAVIADLGRLRQVLLNLLSNAVKFTEGGEVTLRVSSHPVRGGRDELQFAIEDTGIGIPAKAIKKLFGAFTQADASTSRVYGGTGLGLAITKALVELMGGKIRVESKVGRGSTFRFTVSVQATDMPPEAELHGQADLVGLRVLIVDDNATNRRVSAGYVARWGMVPVEASRPSDALRLLRKEAPFDVALLDHYMPEMDGIQLAARMKKMRPDLPLVMLDSVQGRAKAYGDFAAIVTKPIKLSPLHDAVVAALHGGAVPSGAPLVPALDAGMASRHPLRILVAEDNLVNQKLAAALLTKLGYQPDFASNGAEAVEAVARQSYDVVLMDVQMPEMDGLQASRAICKGGARSPRPRIVALTANATPEDRRDCLEAGMDDYVTKPMTPPILVEALGRSARVDYEGDHERPARKKSAKHR